MKKLVHEVIDAVANVKKKSDKIAILKANDSGALRDVLRGTYDPRIEWLLPAGTPPYVPNKPESTPSNLIKECIKFQYIVKGAVGNSVTQSKRESIFIGLLEAIDPKDAELVLGVIAKTPIKGVSKALAVEVFPFLFE